MDDLPTVVNEKEETEKYTKILSKLIEKIQLRISKKINIEYNYKEVYHDWLNHASFKLYISLNKEHTHYIVESTALDDIEIIPNNDMRNEKYEYLAEEIAEKIKNCFGYNL